MNASTTSFTISPNNRSHPSTWKKRKTRITLIDVQSNHHHIASTWKNKEAFINCMLGLRWGGVCSLMPPNNTPVYSVLGLPLLNTFLTFQRLHSIQKSAKRDLRCLFSLLLGGEGWVHNDPLRTTWDLVVGGGGGGGDGVGGGGDKAWHCLGSIGSRCYISLARACEQLPPHPPTRCRVALGERNELF